MLIVYSSLTHHSYSTFMFINCNIYRLFIYKIESQSFYFVFTHYPNFDGNKKEENRSTTILRN